MRFFISVLFCLLSSSSIAQAKTKAAESRKGEVTIIWGWNRSWYSNSDIRFTGEDYDFTLHDVLGEDRQTPFDPAMYFLRQMRPFLLNERNDEFHLASLVLNL